MDGLAEQPLLLYLALVLVTACLPAVRDRALAGAGLALLALGMAADRVGAGESGTTFASINEILMGAGAVIVLLAAARAWKSRGAGSPPAADARPAFAPDFLLVLLFAGLLTAELGPQLILVAAGIFLVLISGTAAAVRARRPPWIGLAALASALLGGGFFLLFTILGPLSGKLTEIAAGPVSPPAERLLVMLLGSGSSLIAGLFPFHRAPWRLTLAPVAAILLARVMIPALSGGLGDWQAPAMLWLALAVAVAAFQRRWAGAMVAGGLLGMWSGRPEGISAGWVLLLFGWLVEIRVLPIRMPSTPQWERWPLVWFLAPMASIPFVLANALEAQVLVTVFAALAVAVALGIEAGRHTRSG
ncbi:MAG TPA: hypothetical protein VFU23_07640 [Gemmatimonadales bacterium]|nr:hypothetical protein [Gemmatimonadales bacterium]